MLNLTNKRYAGALAAGFGVTYALVFLMSTLIASGKSAITRNNDLQFVDFVRVKQDESIKFKDMKPEKPEKPQTPPPPQMQIKPDLLKPQANMDTSFSFNPNFNVAGNLMAAGEGDYLPIVKVLPEYPQRAASRGIEGYVIVEFMVTKLGTVQNPVVVKAEPPGYFERAALKAASKFRYKPKIINGEPVDVAGVQNKITFQMESSSKQGAGSN
jgi:periplasmic protein TonB